MMLMHQNEIRTRSQIDAIRTPDPTDTWYPLAFGEALDIVDETLDKHGLIVEKQQLGVARKETQLFASWTLQGEYSEHNGTLALRGSINKSLSWSGIFGSTIAACTNLDLWSGSYMAIRKNTRYVKRDLATIVDRIIAEALPEYERKAHELDHWRSIPADLDAGFEFLGRAFGHGIVNTRQLAHAAESWRYSEVEAHRDERNAFGVYMALTQGLKSGPLGDTVVRYAKARNFFASAVKA